MNKDQVWETIRNDKSTVYGEPLLHAFLKITNKLSPEHFEQLKKEQKNLISPSAIFYLFKQFDDLQIGLNFIGLENFNKIENPLNILLYKDEDQYAELIIDLTIKHHKNADQLAYNMVLFSKDPAQIIRHFGVDKIYNEAQKKYEDVDYNITRKILARSFDVAKQVESSSKFEEVADLLKSKISAISKDPQKMISILDDFRSDLAISRKFALKYIDKLTSDHISMLSRGLRDPASWEARTGTSRSPAALDFLWKVFEKQGLDEFDAYVLSGLIGSDPEKAIQKIGIENIRKAVINKHGKLKITEMSSVVGKILMSDLKFAEVFGSEVITLMDHLDLENLFRHYQELGKEQLKLAFETIKKYHKDLDKKIQRSDALKYLIGGQNDA